MSQAPVATYTINDFTRSDLYHNSFLIRQDNILDAVVKHAKDEGLPVAIAVSPAQGKWLKLITKSIGAKNVLEIGTLGGYSTIWFARALPADGHVTTLELNPRNAKVAQENFQTAGLSDKISVIVGPAADSLTKLHPEQPFDLVFIDADKESNVIYYNEAKRLVRPGGVIIVDNVVKYGKVADPAESDGWTEGVRSLLRVLKDDDEVEATTIHTVGERAFDGFIYAVKK